MLNRIKPIFHHTRRAAAQVWLNRFHQQAIQIGVTGSYGKTSTTYALNHVLAKHAHTLMTDLNLDTIYNVPITALKVRDHRYVIFELGIDRPNEMSLHLEIARPDIALITGITPVHSDEHHLGSLEAIIQEKRKLIEGLRPENTAVLHYDDRYVREMAGHTRAKVLWYGTESICDYQAVDIKTRISGSRFKISTPSGLIPIETPLLGTHSCVNLTGAAAVADTLGVPHEVIQAAFADLQPLKGRLNIEPGPKGIILINDALRANPASTRAGLAFLGALPTTGRKIAVLGEMGELGDSEIEQHKAIGRAAAEAGLDLLVCVGSLTGYTAESARRSGMPPSQVFNTSNVKEAADLLQARARSGDLVYLKGSLMRHLERITLQLADEQVGCHVISCPFYHQCPECEYLETGYTPGAGIH